MRRLLAAPIVLACAFYAPPALAQQDSARQDSAQQETGRGQQYAQTSNDYFQEPYYVATPDQLIRQGIDRLVGFMMAVPDADETRVRAFVDLEIAQYFDFGYMARWAAGPLFHRLSPQHRAAMAEKLRGLFLDALSRNLGTLERPLPRVDVFPARPGRTMREARVYSRVLSEKRPPLRLEFRFYWSPQGWKVYDTVANGASAVAFYRGYFTSNLRRHGPDTLLR